MESCGIEALCTQCGATLAHVSPEELAARVRERDQAREVAGWRQGDEYDRTDYQRRVSEAWYAARENAEEVLRWQQRAARAEQRLMDIEAELLRCLQTKEVATAAAFTEGMRSVLRQRCIKHRDVPQLNANAIGGAEGNGECGACVQDQARLGTELDKLAEMDGE